MLDTLDMRNMHQAKHGMAITGTSSGSSIQIARPQTKADEATARNSVRLLIRHRREITPLSIILPLVGNNLLPDIKSFAACRSILPRRYLRQSPGQIRISSSLHQRVLPCRHFQQISESGLKRRDGKTHLSKSNMRPRAVPVHLRDAMKNLVNQYAYSI